MADHSMSNIALCILPTASLATITGLTTTVTTADGLVVGVGSTGDGGSGIELPEHERIGLELARLSSSSVASSFLREQLSSLKITFPLAGGRNTSSNPTVDADFALSTYFPGFDAILAAGGLTGGAWGGGVGHNYLVAAPTSAAMAAFFGGLKVTYTEVYTTLKFTLTPGEAGLVEATFSAGAVNSWGAQTLSTVTSGNQATAPPVVQNAANAWGATRPYTSLEITVDGNIEKSPDSNAATGLRVASQGVDIKFKAQLYAATSDPDYERDQAILTTAPTGDMTFSIGSATGVSSTCNSYVVNLNNVTPDKYKPAKIGTYLGWDVDGTCNAISTAATEFALLFR